MVLQVAGSLRAHGGFEADMHNQRMAIAPVVPVKTNATTCFRETTEDLYCSSNQLTGETRLT